MIRKVLAIAVVMFGMFSLNSCRDTTEKETIVREVEVDDEQPEIKVEVTKEEEENEGILERTAKEVDKEVNKEINQEIDNIGDDN